MDKVHENVEIKISIIIPMYNSEKTIQRCIDSIIESHYHNLEILVIDDGSTDNSKQIVTAYNDDRIRYYYKVNGGSSSARNYGINEATGEYIWFVDSDDFIEPDFLNKCVSVLIYEKPEVFFFNIGVYFEKTSTKVSINDKKITKNTLLNREYVLQKILPVMVNLKPDKEYFIESYCVNKIYRMDIIRDNNITFDERLRKWNDRIFVVEILKYAQSFYYFPITGYYYILRHDSISYKYDGSVFTRILAGNAGYKKLLGDELRFGTLYELNYYPKLFINTIVSQFGLIDLNENLLNSDLLEAVHSTEAKKMFMHFSAKTSFEKKTKSCILTENIDSLIHLCKMEYLHRKQKEIEKEKRSNTILYRGLNKIKRTLIR